MEKRTQRNAAGKSKRTRALIAATVLVVLTLLLAPPLPWWGNAKPEPTMPTASAASAQQAAAPFPATPGASTLPEITASPQALLAALSDADAGQRALAVLGLMQLAHKNSAPDLQRLLRQDPDARVRAVAALTLGDWQVRSATPDVLALLKSDSGVSTDVVLDALTRMADPAAAPAVLPLLESAHDVTRLLAVQALQAMQAKDVVPALLQQAKRTQDPEKTKTYVMALGYLQASQAQGYLLDVAQRSEASPTLWATYLALGRVRSDKAVDLLVQALGSPHEKGQENAKLALHEIASPRTPPLLWPLLAHAQASVRYAASDLLVDIAHPQTNAQLLLALQQTPAQGAAALALGRRKVLQALAPIEKALLQRSTPERETLALALGWLGDARAVPTLRQVLAEPDGEGRYGAAWSLGTLRAQQARPDLERASASSDPRLASAAVDALAMMANAADMPFLLRQAKANPNLALSALGAVAQLPEDAARLELERLLKHNDRMVRTAALQGLLQRKDRASVPALIERLENGPDEQHKALQSVLGSITGEHFGSAAQWRQWHSQQSKR